MSLSSCGIFAYSFNQIGEIIQEMQKSKAEFQQKMRMLNYLMSKRAIDTQLQTRIRKYYEYYYQQKYQSDLDINHVIENLSSILKEEVFRDLYGKKLSPEVIDSLALRVKEKKFVAEEYIFQEKDHDDKIYILIQGELELVSKENGRTYTLLKRYKREEIIGEEEFFNESLRQYSLKACNSSLVAFLTRQDFYEVLQKYPEQYEFYRQLKDKIMLFNQHQTLGIKCIICDKYSHKYDKCPFLNLEERKHMVIHNSNKSYDQKRVKVKRFQQRYNSRNNQAVVQNAMHLFEVEYESRLNLRTDSEISQTYEGYEVKTRSKVVLSQVEFNPINSQVNNIFLHEPLGSFCNFKNELSSYKDNISQMEKSDKEDILSQVSLRGMQLQNNQQTQQPSQLLLLQPSSQPQTLQVLIDYKSEVSNKGKRNSDLIQIKLPVQGNQAQKTQPINSNQIGQQLVTNAQNNPNQQIISLNFDQLQNQKNLKQNNESFTDLEQSSHNQQNFQRKDDKKKSTRIIKRSSIAQQDSLPSGLNAIISSSNNQLYVNRQGTRNQTFHQNERKNTINEKSQTSQMQNGLIFYLEFCQFDYEQIFDIGKDFKKYFVSNNPQNIIKAYNYSQFKNRSKQKTQNQRKSKKKIASPSKPRKSCKYVKSPQSVIANSQPQI